MKIVVSPRAKADLLRLNAFLAEKNEAAALRAMDLIDSGLRSLAAFPGRTPSRGDGLRTLSIRFGGSGYVVDYKVDRDTVVIAGVFHMREDRG